MLLFAWQRFEAYKQAHFLFFGLRHELNVTDDLSLGFLRDICSLGSLFHVAGSGCAFTILVRLGWMHFVEISN